MSEEAPEPPTESAVTSLIDYLMEREDLTFDEDGRVLLDEEQRRKLEYAAICHGFGFPLGFTPNCHSTLSDDLENEYYGARDIIDQVDVGPRHTYYEHTFERDGLAKLLGYWYVLGWQQQEWGFPYSDGVTAADFMTMSEAERSALTELE